MMVSIIRTTLLAVMLVGVTATSVVAQSPTATAPKRATVVEPTAPQKTPRAEPPSGPRTPRSATPQIVTIVHRLNGLKMFRLLLRSEEDVQAVTRIDEAFQLMDDVHTNVIAGLALDDGETIAAWLPEAEVEFGLPMARFPTAPALVAPSPLLPRTAPEPPEPQGAKSPRPRSYFPDVPELTVIGADGQKLAARYVGLDGLTGLSILKLVDKKPNANRPAKEETVGIGSNIRVFGPELAAQTRAVVAGSLFVRMGEANGTIQGITHAPSGDVARFKLRSPRLKLAFVGGVAVNDAGEAVGIVNGIEGADATVLPTALIRRAAKRVLAQQSSVPRPFLGVRGEPIATLTPAQVEGLGWQLQEAASLIDERRGILLTSILPDSPAARAQLKVGDVILKVNEETIQNADDFSWWLNQAGTSNSVKFTVLRPQSKVAEAVDVKLSSQLETQFSYEWVRRPVTRPKQFSLFDRGVETIALRTPVAARLGAAAGLLVVYVAPDTPGAEAGLEPGDVIQTIDGKPVELSARTLISNQSTHRIEVVRKKEKIVVTLKTDNNR